MSRSHPKLNERYFKMVNTKDKAYWLGFLYADGNIHIRKWGSAEIDLSIDKKDEYAIDRFINSLGLNKNKKRYDKSMVRIRLVSTKMSNDLIKYGCIPRKSLIIELPILESRELYLSFLLGYFDGDGKQGTSGICSGSLIFLEQIKKKFEVPYKITEYKGRNVYYLSLGVDLFNNMLDNYKHSLPRKRIYLCAKEERIHRVIIASKNNTGKKKFDITKEELEQLVWEVPTTKIAEKFGVSDKAIAKRCKRLNINKPSRGYWAKKRSIKI